MNSYCTLDIIHVLSLLIGLFGITLLVKKKVVEVSKGFERIGQQLALQNPKSVAAAIINVEESKDAIYAFMSASNSLLNLLVYVGNQTLQY